MYISPRKLRRGSRVALVAPSSPFDAKEVMEGMDIMKEEGLIPVLGPCVKNLKSDNIHAAPVKDRSQELNWAFSDPSIEGVITTNGGAGSAALLPYLDYHMIRKTRKAFLGMSDTTSLNNGILACAGLITFVGQTPSIRLDKGTSIRNSDSESFRMTLKLLMSGEEWGTKPFNLNEGFPRTICPGTGEGFALGGNLDTFVHLIGTKYFPETSNSVLFLEDVHKSGTSIGRHLLHLQLAGIISQTNAVVLGEFAEVPKTSDQRTPSVEKAISEYFMSGPPCTYGYPFSHGPFTGPIPIGSHCYVDATEGIVNFQFKMG
jgi:muramoyltetrapeptide carboxypeptidase